MYYVYVLTDPINNLPFYIGVGKENRKSGCVREKQHIIDAIRLREGKKLLRPNRHKLYTILKILDQNLEVTIDIVAKFDNEIDAFIEEIKLIKQHGRSDLGLGPLTNLTDGGEGGVNPSIETRLKQSLSKKGKPSPLKGRTDLGPYTEERCKNISKANKGRPSPLKGKKGKQAWNKGLTKETSENVAKYSVSNPNKGFKKGHTITKKGTKLVKDKSGNKFRVSINDERITTGELEGIHKGRVAHNKGKPGIHKGKTYEEIYGPEKAAELRENRRLSNLRRWNKILNQ
jgi:hypothetical protein